MAGLSGRGRDIASVALAAGAVGVCVVVLRRRLRRSHATATCTTSSSPPSVPIERLAAEAAVQAKVRLVASDLDGTFLDRREHRAPAANIEAIVALQAVGLAFVVATGRNRASAQGALPGLDLGSRPGIYLNGAVVHGTSGDIVHERTVPREVALDVLHVIAMERQSGRESAAIFVSGDGHYAPEVSDCTWARHLHEVYDDIAPTCLGSYNEAKTRIPGSVHNLHVTCSSDILPILRDSLKPVVGDRASLVQALPTCLTIRHQTTNKADGLQMLLQREFDLSLKQVLAFGDAENDAEMLQAAGVGVAMGNAAQTAKQAANFVVEDCDADPPGVAAVIHELTRALTQGIAQ